ncbi:MAG: NAD(P)-dependent oxidoreductase, partial [Actinomycetia bacterium]|nr:NAD(P)-dependent oxidoreductase [Actinomycetes bacterium]
MTIGFIGLGVMGEPMARNLVTRGTDPVVVTDLRPEPVERLVAEGAKAAASVSDVVEQSEVVLLSLPGGEQLEAVVGGDDGILSADVEGKLIVDHTTAPVTLTRALGERCRAAGAEYCDAPIARTRQAAIDGTLAIMVGGSAEAFARLKPMLAPMATDVSHCGELGAGQVTKLLNNMMLFNNVRAIAEAHAIAEGLGVDVERIFSVIAEASGGSFALSNHGMKAVLTDTYPTQAFSTEYAIKDLDYALDLAAEVGIDAVG